ncbi:MAG: APC family permease [Ruminococcaceae bacterium]|nr:APC family permease [Oscillospiraceae bacterium]
MENSTKLQKKYGLVTAICMVVGIVIGSGVFFKAQNILVVTEGNMSIGIAAWLVGGIIMLFNILAFAQLAQNYSKVNGLTDYAEATVGNKYSYYVGWFMAFIYAPTISSVLVWLTARYTLTFICSVNPDFAMHISNSDGGTVFGPETMAFAALFLCLSFAINALSPKIAGKIQVSTTVIKLIPLVLMMIVGTIYGLTHMSAEQPEMTILAHNFATGSGAGDTFFSAIVATAFAYEGWIMATSINAELKNAKRNLPIALIVGAAVIVAVYVFYFIGIAGGASVEDLQTEGATVAFVHVFGPVLGNILNLFVAVSCFGTLNGLMLGCTRSMYALAARNHGPSPKIFSQVDSATNMPANSGIAALLITGIWFVFFYGAQLAPENWFGVFGFDSSELPIVTLYAFYIPIYIAFMKKAKGLHPVKRFVFPILACISSLMIIFCAVYAHGYVPYLNAKENGTFSFPVLFYLIVFAVVMIIGIFFYKSKKSDAKEVSAE